MKITKKILSEEQIQERIIKLASEINTDYEGKNLMILGVLKGAFIAISDLAKNLNIDVSLRPLLKKIGFLTSDSRVVLLKKVGIRMARKDFHYSKI